jgi:GAF domain-containing protein
VIRPSGLDAIADACAREVATAFQCGAIIYTVARAPEEILVPLAAHDIDASRLARSHALQLVKYRLGEKLPGRVWQAANSILIPTVDLESLAETAHPAMSEMILEFHVRSRMLAPIQRDGTVLGVLDAVRCGATAVPFDEMELDQLESFAEEAAARWPNT